MEVWTPTSAPDGQDRHQFRRLGLARGQIASNGKDLKAATAIREKEAKDFEAADAELTETIGRRLRFMRVVFTLQCIRSTEVRFSPDVVCKGLFHSDDCI